MAELELLDAMERVAREAGRAILAIDRDDMGVERKADATPVTVADLRAHGALRAGLARIDDLPFVSEEGDEIPHATRASWSRYWLVDPLDGTREYVRGSDDFTVNVALVAGTRAVAGVVHAPALGVTYLGAPGRGAYVRHGDAPPSPIRVAAPRGRELVVLLSRSHAGPETLAFVDGLRERNDVRVGSRGGALKACLVAEGRAHLYPRYGPTWEWDTAAPQAIVEAAGGVVLAIGGDEPLRYTTPTLRNPPFLVAYGREAPRPHAT